MDKLKLRFAADRNDQRPGRPVHSLAVAVHRHETSLHRAELPTALQPIRAGHCQSTAR